MINNFIIEGYTSYNIEKALSIVQGELPGINTTDSVINVGGGVPVTYQVINERKFKLFLVDSIKSKIKTLKASKSNKTLKLALSYII